MDNYNHLRQAYEYATAQQVQWYRLYQECYKYAMPNRNNYWQGTQARKNDLYMYDSTAQLAVRAFVAKTQSSLTPPGINWCNLRAGQLIPDDKKDEINNILQTLNNEMFADLRQSNFDPTIAESYFDLAAGTGALYVKETPDQDCPFWFEAVSLYLICAYENSKGLLTNVFRQYRYMQYYQLKLRFPYIKEWPQWIEDSIQNDPFGFYPMVDAWIDQEDGTWKHYVANDGLQEIFYESEPETSSPWIIYRWSKLPGELYGRGPLMDVIGDIKVCNKMMEQFIKQASYAVNPAYAYYSQYLNPNNLTLEPGAMVAVKATGTNMKPLEPLFAPGNLEMGEWGFNKWWQNINQGLYANPLGPMNDPTKTATEIEYRQQMYAEEVGPALGRLQQELLNPLIKRLIHIKIKRGGMPKDVFPNNKWTSIAYESPLIQNQKTNDLRNIEAFTQGLAQIAGPNAPAAALDLPQTIKKLAELTNIPLEILKTEDQIQAMQQASQQAAAQQQKLNTLQQLSQINQNGGGSSMPNIPQGASVLPGAPQQ